MQSPSIRRRALAPRRRAGRDRIFAATSCHGPCTHLPPRPRHGPAQAELRPAFPSAEEAGRQPGRPERRRWLWRPGRPHADGMLSLSPGTCAPGGSCSLRVCVLTGDRLEENPLRSHSPSLSALRTIGLHVRVSRHRQGTQDQSLLCHQAPGQGQGPRGRAGPVHGRGRRQSRRQRGHATARRHGAPPCQR